MDKLDPHKKDTHSGTEIVAKKKAEYKYLGAGKRPHRGMDLWALDLEKAIVYKVPIIPKEEIMWPKDGKARMSEKEIVATSKVTINPNHPTVWAINVANAMKKFMKLKFQV